MDHQRLTQTLDELADDAEPRAVDVLAVMAMANARTKSRRTTILAGGATVVLIGALTVATNGFGTNEAVPGVAPTTTIPAPKKTAEPPPPAQYNDRSEKLNDQLAGLVPREFTVEQPLKFAAERGPTAMNYTAKTVIQDAEGTATLQIWVLKKPAGTQLSHYNGQMFGPCEVGDEHCERRVLQDGTVATAQPNARPPALSLSSTLSAQRPDGTYIQVITNVAKGASPKPRATAPFTADELFKFATAFTY